MQQFSIEYLADLCHWSPTHFRRVFHDIMGTSPLDYVNNTRILKSCILLRSTEHSILDISEMVGFHSVSSFNRYFIKLMQMSPREYRKQMQQQTAQRQLRLAGLAAISLFVAALNIANTMTMAIYERTREIGIRKAMGAKEKTILAQFVTEAATTSALGGTLGIVLGYIVSAIANQVLPMFTDGMDITVSPSFNSIAAAFGISVFIGVLFGYLPAKRAARLNPIDALRYD